MKMTNGWNQFIYKLWAPVYDGTVNTLFMRGRKRAMNLLDLQPGESVLLVGVGTGADLPLLPARVRAVGIDLSATMLSKAHSKLPIPQCETYLIQGDGQIPLAAKDTFDAVILNLILSVIPDARACFQTAVEVLKPTGRIIIFDKFLPDDRHPSILRKLLNYFSTFFGTDINRRLGDILPGSGLKIVRDEADLFGGTYRVILLKREV
jgi:phosphatidylethanolamine/phosphatidyl-N-methylethanolamine N-methyltransferase